MKPPENSKYYTLADFEKMNRVEDLPFKPHPMAEHFKSFALLARTARLQRAQDAGEGQSLAEFENNDGLTPDPDVALPVVAKIPLKGCEV